MNDRVQVVHVFAKMGVDRKALIDALEEYQQEDVQSSTYFRFVKAHLNRLKSYAPLRNVLVVYDRRRPRTAEYLKTVLGTIDQHHDHAASNVAVFVVGTHPVSTNDQRNPAMQRFFDMADEAKIVHQYCDTRDTNDIGEVFRLVDALHDEATSTSPADYRRRTLDGLLPPAAKPPRVHARTTINHPDGTSSTRLERMDDETVVPVAPVRRNCRCVLL